MFEVWTPMSTENIPAGHLCDHWAEEHKANRVHRASGPARCPTSQTRSYSCPEHDPQTECPSPCPKQPLTGSYVWRYSTTDSEEVQKDFKSDSGAIHFLYTPTPAPRSSGSRGAVGQSAYDHRVDSEVGEARAGGDGGIWGKGGGLPAGE